MQSYVNNWIKCYAEKTYGITAVAFDDTVDENEYSWFGPSLFIQNPEYYMDEMEKEYGIRCLDIFSNLYEYNFPEYYKGQEWSFFIAKDEGEMATLLIQGLKTDVEFTINQLKKNVESLNDCGIYGYIDEAEFLAGGEYIIKWKDIGGGNYEIYWLS